jgi:hypothetical protein
LLCANADPKHQFIDTTVYGSIGSLALMGFARRHGLEIMECLLGGSLAFQLESIDEFWASQIEYPMGTEVISNPKVAAVATVNSHFEFQTVRGLVAGWDGVGQSACKEEPLVVPSASNACLPRVLGV